MAKHRCDAYKECAYWAEFHIVCPDECQHTMRVCGNCWHGMYKWCGWKQLTKL